jgi:hypothetical protein
MATVPIPEDGETLDFFGGAPPVRALESEYGGIRFRSRTEARWAIYFDNVPVRWVHEPEGYALHSGNYLPDFWLPELETFVEIKGQRPTPLERRLCAELADETTRRVVLFPHEPRAELFFGGGEVWWPGGADDGFAFCVCPVCRKVGIEFEGRGARVCGNDCCPGDDRQHTGDAPRLVEAARRALGFRFYEPGRRSR